MVAVSIVTARTVGILTVVTLARAVKAALLRRLIAEGHLIERLITSTAAENTAMRRVNTQRGYLPYADIAMLEAETTQVAAILTTPRSVPGPRAPVPATLTR